MAEIGFGQFVAANFWLIVVVVALIAGVALAIVVQRRSHRRRMPVVIDGIRFECHDARVVHDMVIEQDWQVSFLLTNVKRRPVAMPSVRDRGTLMVGRARYAGPVYIENSDRELNPGDHVVVWLVCRLPAGENPGRGVILVDRDVGDLVLAFDAAGVATSLAWG